ncbi:class I SAM-dependent methyltransferase [bacterium]|nr:class I SAM-dependent methyltransferase [bacterium]
MSENYSQKSKEQKDYYNRTAEHYDQWHVDLASARIVDQWNFDNLRDFLGDRKIEKALELGSGTGRMANNLFQVSDEVYGIDQSQEVLKIAQNKYPKLKLSCGEVTNLPYQDNFFDLIIINGSLHHFFAVEKTFQQAYRVLKPGGAFVLLGEPNSQFMKLSNVFYYIWIMDRITAKIFGMFSHKDTPAEPIEPDAESYVPQELKIKLTKSGFDVQRFYTYDYIMRSENKFWLNFYKTYLNFENKFFAKAIPGRGMAIQVFSIKK